MLAVQADGARIETVEGLAAGRRADAAPAGLPRPPRAPVRLLHAGDADGGDGAARAEPAARPRRRSAAACRATSAAAPATGTSSRRSRPPPARRSRSERHGDSETTIAPERVEIEAPAEQWKGQSVPRKEDRRLVQGQGVFVDDIKRHEHGLRALRPLALRARADQVGRRRGGARGPRRLRHAHRRRGRDADRPVLPALDAARQRDQGLRARRRPRALRRRPGRRSSSPRRASSRATPPSSSRSTTSRSTVIVDARTRARARRAGPPPRRRLEPRLGGHLRVGQLGGRRRRGRPDRQDPRAPLRPLQLDAARVRRRARRVQPRHRPVDDLHATTSSPASPRS